MPGYSNTPLAKKLGIKPRSRVAIAQPPDDIEEILDELPDGVQICSDNDGSLDVILFLTGRRNRSRVNFAKLPRVLSPRGRCG